MAATNIIAALQATFPSDQIALPGTEDHTTWNGSYLAQQESDLRPACIFRPATTDEVAQFVRIIEPSAVRAEVAFAIRAAGNMPKPDCANVQNGITLDLNLLTTISLNQDNSVVLVGAGARWQAVDQVVQDVGLGVVGGRSGTGGIGGLALAGGLSFFSTREGFICDNVVNFEVVLASGHVVNANQFDNSDLWLALKGGSNNFGIVTRFDLRTFPQTYPFWGGNVYYYTPSFPSQIESLVGTLNDTQADPSTSISISIGYAAQFGATMCLNTLYYTQGGTTEVPPALAAFTDIQPQVAQLNTLKQVTLTEAAASQAAGVAAQVRCSYMNLTVKADVSTLQSAADLYTAGISPIQRSVAGLVASFTLQPYPLSLLEQSSIKGGNSLGLNQQETGPLVSVLLLTYWSDQSDDGIVGETMKGILDRIRDVAVKMNTDVDFIYLNYASGFQDPIASYGKEIQHQLQDTSKKYDSKGLFQRGVPGGFKLF